jgi:hypothetical protein
VANDTETPVLDLLGAMTALSLDVSNLDPETTMLVRIAALVASDAPPFSYVLNLGVAGEVGVSAEKIRDVFQVVAPIVGTARVTAGIGNIVKALALEELAELDSAQTAS